MKRNLRPPPHIYNLRLTERQVKLLSYTCDQFSRLICGQDWSYQELFEAAWEQRCKEATRHIMDDTWDGGWHAMRSKPRRKQEVLVYNYTLNPVLF